MYFEISIDYDYMSFKWINKYLVPFHTFGQFFLHQLLSNALVKVISHFSFYFQKNSLHTYNATFNYPRSIL